MPRSKMTFPGVKSTSSKSTSGGIRKAVVKPPSKPPRKPPPSPKLGKR